jgi:glutamate racemase
MMIAFFDSGIGGLTLLAEARKRLPNAHCIYLADTAHVPYGTKPKDNVKNYIDQSIRSIMDRNIHALVIACNTATSIAIEEIRKTYSIPVIGMEPAVKPAVAMNRSSGKRVLVVATPLTLRESKYNNLVNRVDDHSIVDSLPLPELVQYGEQLLFDGNEVEQYLRHQFSKFNFTEYGTLVLGCTHFLFFKKLLQRIIPQHMNIIDGHQGTVNRLIECMQRSDTAQLSAGPNVDFVCTDGNQSYINRMKTALSIYEQQVL